MEGGEGGEGEGEERGGGGGRLAVRKARGSESGSWLGQPDLVREAEGQDHPWLPQSRKRPPSHITLA